MSAVWYTIVFAIGAAVSGVSRALRVGAGATWPGEVALFLYPRILTRLSKRVKKGIILIAGTNGKTTTSRMLRTILESRGQTVLHNASGANLLNGIVATFLTPEHAVRQSFDWAIFEVDENSLPNVLRYVTPKAVILLDLFRDQLDRYGEVDAIAESWEKALSPLPRTTTIIVNADDAQLADITDKLTAERKYFGLGDPSLYLPAMQHATDSIYCPRCGNRLTFSGVYFSHLGDWACGRCDLHHPSADVRARDFSSPVPGVYNRYNTLAAAACALVLGIPKTDIEEGLSRFTPAFGRMEQLSVRGVPVRILLSKNPTGFNESVRTMLAEKDIGGLVLLLNDRIPDGTDVSWIWDVDFELLRPYTGPVWVSGDRVWDMAVRLKYSGLDRSTVVSDPDLTHTLDEAISHVQEGKSVWVLATYSAMLDTRKILTGKKIL